MISIRWFVVCAAPPAAGRAVGRTAHAQPPGPGSRSRPRRCTRRSGVADVCRASSRPYSPAGTARHGAHDLRRLRPPASRHRSRVRPRSGSTPSTPSSTTTARPAPASCCPSSSSGPARRQVSFPATVSTPYVNTIPREQEPWFPGDEHIERRIRAFIRWNAAVMVVKANKHADGIGGHLSTFACSASLYEVGFNHFFRGKDDGHAGDHVYFQGHAAPGIYARAFLEGRLTDDDLDHFRREIGRDGKGLSSYPHPRLMPDFWEFPTVSMGLGPINVDLPRPLQPLPPEPPARRHQPEPGVVLPRRRRVRRARDARRPLAGRPREARQPDLRRQLQPAAPRRPGARQRQDHPGARGRASAAPAGTSSRSSGARSGTSCWPATSTACCSTR